MPVLSDHGGWGRANRAFDGQLAELLAELNRGAGGSMTDVVGKLWGFCHTLRHDGIDYGDYIEQLTYLLFLKMADERGIELPEQAPTGRTCASRAAPTCSTPTSRRLRTLGKQPGILGDIFSGAQNRFTNPVNLQKLIGLIDETEWTALDVDVKAAAFEGLLEKAAAEGKKGAGQYFTPRVLIQSMVRCIQPDPRVSKDFTIGDPACGTGGFLVAAYEWLKDKTGGAFDRDTAQRIRKQHLLRPGARRPTTPTRPHEPVPAPGRAAHHARRLDLRSADQPALRRRPDQSAVRHQGRQPGARTARTSSSRPATSSSTSSSTC